MLDYFDIWYVIRNPNHIQSMQNNSKYLNNGMLDCLDFFIEKLR